MPLVSGHSDTMPSRIPPAQMLAKELRKNSRRNPKPGRAARTEAATPVPLPIIKPQRARFFSPRATEGAGFADDRWDCQGRNLPHFLAQLA